MKKLILAFFLVFVSAIALAQSSKDLTVIGDKLVGTTIDGYSVRKVIGNVVITQDDLVINCNIAYQYITLKKIILVGDVVAVQDTVTLKTEKGFYDGNNKYAWSDTALYMDDGHINLTADSGNYSFSTKIANFFENVELIDTINTLNCDRLHYNYKNNKSVSVGNVKIADTTGTIYCDSLIHFRDTQLAYAYKNVKILGEQKGAVILGEELINNTAEKYSKITGNPILFQIDTTKTGKIDTLLVSSKIMESWSDSTKRLVVTDSVKIIRGKFSALTDNATLFRETNNIFTFRKSDEHKPPVMWYGNSQVVGDSIRIFLKNKALRNINIVQDAFILTRSDSFDLRFDQISGKKIDMYFGAGELQKTFVDGNVLSIYYMYDGGKPNGLIKSSGGVAKIYFDSSKVADVRLYDQPVTEYHPEVLVEGAEKEFTLPQFLIYKNRPDKELLLNLFVKRERLSGR